MTFSDLVDEILASVLPEELLNDIPTAFSQAGHIGMLNVSLADLMTALTQFAFKSTTKSP